MSTVINKEVRLIGYRPELQHHFEGLNMHWIKKYFTVEPMDIEVLGQPDKYIIQAGGNILFAVAEENIVGTVAIKPVDADTVEMTKMAVDEAYQGYKIGWRLAEGIISLAKEKGYKRVVLYSNTRLVPALTMYQRLGFREIPVEPGRYKRCSIKMELIFEEENRHYAIADKLTETINKAVPQLQEISDEAAAERPGGGKWSPKEIIGHLVDSAINNNVRFIRLQEISLLEIPGYNQDFWVKGQAWQFSSWRELIDLWANFNRHLAFTIRAMPASVLQHKCRINDREPVTLEFLVTDYLSHLKHHLLQVKVNTEDTI